MQKSIDIYPNLMNDEFAKNTLREIKNSMVKRYKSGSLYIRGKYTFLLPDFYAACQYWFNGEDNPKGLLSDGEVFCWLFRKDEEVDCLRSPHLFMEHAIRKNTAYYQNQEKQQSIREWFTTNAIYTSCNDMISKILQFDVDGDKALVVADKTIISVAKRNLKKYDIVPLYYNMKKASPIQLNSESIYSGLNAAFTGGNIGIYSNNISKIWNSDIFINGTEEEKKEAIDLIKILCMENNFVIDYAKTLYKPERPKDINKKINSFTNNNLPHFFIYAKDKEVGQVENVNKSFVNKLESKIHNPRINCRYIGLKSIDYTKMVNNPDIECRAVFNKNGKLNEELSDPMIVKYYELNQKYHFKVNMKCSDMVHGELWNNLQLRHDLFYKKADEDIRNELSKFGYTESEVADILVKFLYYVKPSSHKSVLWFCYGKYIFENLQKHFRIGTKFVECVDCGEWIEVNTKDNETCRCSECKKKHIKLLRKEQNKRAYEKRKQLSNS